jgi:hypothetical protein
MESVIAVMTERLGPPDNDSVSESPFDGDSGYNACQSATGYPCHDYLRWITWTNIGIRLQFSDVIGDGRGGEKGAPNLRGYQYRTGEDGLPLQTEQGITPGWTVAQLQDLGDFVAFGADACVVNVMFSVTDPDSTDEGAVWGSITGTDAQSFFDTGAIDPDALVESIGAGPWSSC